MIYIYGLIDPFTSKVRYIGKTVKLKQRLDNQCNEKSKTYRSNWIQSLLKKGKKPVQVILQTLQDNEDWQFAERRWIYVAKKYGWNLVNTTDGGDGVLNLSGESKERMLKTWVGRKHKPESIEKMRKANSGRIKTDLSKDKLSSNMAGRKVTWKDKLQYANRKFDEQKLQQIITDLSNGMKVIDAALKYKVHRTTVTKIKNGSYLTFKQKTYNYVKPRRFHKLL